MSLNAVDIDDEGLEWLRVNRLLRSSTSVAYNATWYFSKQDRKREGDSTSSLNSSPDSDSGIMTYQVLVMAT
jgi:hypothetical protein